MPSRWRKPPPSVAKKGCRLCTHLAADHVALADGLTADVLTCDAADHIDMMAFYPPGAPTDLIACIESDAEALAAGRLNPGVPRIALADGKVETIVRGTSSCYGTDDVLVIEGLALVARQASGLRRGRVAKAARRSGMVSLLRGIAAGSFRFSRSGGP